MNNFQKTGIILLIIVIAAYIKLAFFSTSSTDQPVPIVSERQTEEEELVVDKSKKEENSEKIYVNVFFIGQNENREEVYKAVKREYEDTNESKLKFAIYSLIKGPTAKERNMGVYTEIPATTRVISITETSSRAIINLSSDFEQGGGTDGLYKRLFQLIKTAKRNTNLPVYLYLDNNQVDVIGGEGIMINQPLSEDFINE